MPSVSDLLPRQVTNVNGNNDPNYDLYSSWWYGSVRSPQDSVPGPSPSTTTLLLPFLLTAQYSYFLP